MWSRLIITGGKVESLERSFKHQKDACSVKYNSFMNHSGEREKAHLVSNIIYSLFVKKSPPTREKNNNN